MAVARRGLDAQLAVVFCLTLALDTTALPMHVSGQDRATLMETKNLTYYPDWVQLSREPPDSKCQLELIAAVRLEGIDGLSQKFHECSQPTSPSFAQFWTREELCKHVNASKQTMQQVNSWLAAAGLELRQDPALANAGFVQAVGTVSQIESLLAVRLHRFVHKEFPLRTILRTSDEVSVPIPVRPLLDFISGVSDFPSIRKHTHSTVKDQTPPTTSNSSRDGGEGRPHPPPITPDVLVHLYGLDQTSSPGAAHGSVGAAGWQWQAFSSKDLHAFQRRFGLEEADVTRVVGKGSSWWGHVEGNLDVEYLMAVSREAPHSDGSAIESEYWLSPGFGFDVVKWVVQVQADGASPLVWSLSYGEGLSTVSPEYARRLNTEFMKLAVLGVSVLVASGDSGVYSRQGKPNVYDPSFPACLPCVTAVGATELNADGAEAGGTSWSGGGFALAGYFPRASEAAWQEEAVAAYLQRSEARLPDSSRWNRGGRAIPDVSAVGVNYRIVQQRITSEVSGTSASTPVVAAMVALLNSARMALEPPKGPLGHLNKLLYQQLGKGDRGAMHDMTAGRNDAGRVTGGFEAAVGWDPVTGLGTPVFEAWRAAAIEAP